MKDFNCAHAYRGAHKEVACDVDNKPCKYQRWCEMDGEWQTTNNCANCNKKGQSKMIDEIKKEEIVLEEKVEEKPKKKAQPPKKFATVVNIIKNYGTIIEDENGGAILLRGDYSHQLGDKIEL